MPAFFDPQGVRIARIGALSGHVMSSGETSTEMARIAPDDLVAAGRDLDGPDVDAIFIPCTAVRTLDAIEPLEAAIGKPVITAIHATMWRCPGSRACPTTLRAADACSRSHRAALPNAKRSRRRSLRPLPGSRRSALCGRAAGLLEAQCCGAGSGRRPRRPDASPQQAMRRMPTETLPRGKGRTDSRRPRGGRLARGHASATDWSRGGRPQGGAEPGFGARPEAGHHRTSVPTPSMNRPEIGLDPGRNAENLLLHSPARATPDRPSQHWRPTRPCPDAGRRIARLAPSSSPRPPPRGLAATRNRAGVEGPAAALGPLVPPDVLVPRELSGSPCARVHRSVFAPR